MSLLEDVFLEDEAGEAQELERVIEGDEFDERPARNSDDDSNENSEKEDEAEEDKRRVDPTSDKPKKVSRNPRVLLNPARLTGPRGIQVIPEHFKDFKFKGKGHEKEDLDLVLKKLEHWAYRLYPKFQFEDCLKKIETLGKKRPVAVHLHKIRSDQYISEDIVVQKDSSDDEAPQPPQEEDEFDKLLQQQIELARATPAPSSAKKGFGTPRVDTPSFLMPKATSSPSISEEQKERMLRNRRMAEERRLARLKQAEQNISVINEVPIEVENEQNGHIETSETVLDNEPIIVENHQNEFMKKLNRTNVIDSSDDEEELVMNKSITVDVHDTRPSNDDTEEQSKSAKRNRTDVMDSCDEEIAKDAVYDENHEEATNESIKRKPNVIDSEESDDVAVEISTDIKDKSNNFDACGSNNGTSDEIMTIVEEKANTQVNNPDVVIVSHEMENNTVQNEIHNDCDASSEQTGQDNDLEVVGQIETNKIEVDITKDSNADSKTCVENSTPTKELKNTSTNKENIDNNIHSEIMDVDFDEDF